MYHLAIIKTMKRKVNILKVIVLTAITSLTILLNSCDAETKTYPLDYYYFVTPETICVLESDMTKETSKFYECLQLKLNKPFEVIKDKEVFNHLRTFNRKNRKLTNYSKLNYQQKQYWDAKFSGVKNLIRLIKLDSVQFERVKAEINRALDLKADLVELADTMNNIYPECKFEVSGF